MLSPPPSSPHPLSLPLSLSISPSLFLSLTHSIPPSPILSFSVRTSLTWAMGIRMEWKWSRGIPHLMSIQPVKRPNGIRNDSTGFSSNIYSYLGNYDYIVLPGYAMAHIWVDGWVVCDVCQPILGMCHSSKWAQNMRRFMFCLRELWDINAFLRSQPVEMKRKLTA